MFIGLLSNDGQGSSLGSDLSLRQIREQTDEKFTHTAATHSSEDNQESVSVLQSSVEAAPPADPKPDVPSSSVESVDIQSGAETSRQTVTDTDPDNSTFQEHATPAVIAPQIVPVSAPPAQQPIVVPVVEMPKPPVMDLPPILTPTPKPVVAEEKAVIVPAAPVSPVMITVQADIGGNATTIVLERDATVQQVWDAVRVECDRLQIKGHLSSIVNASGLALPGKDGQGMTGKHGLTELATISVVVIPEPNTSDGDVKKESSQSDLDIKAHMREAAQKPLLNEQIILGDEPAQSKSKRAQTFSPSRKSKFSLVERAFDAGQEQSRCSIVAEERLLESPNPNPKRQSMATSLVKDALADGQHLSRVSVVVDTESSEQQNHDSGEGNTVVPVSPPPAQQLVVIPVVKKMKPPVMDLPPILTPTPKPVVEREKAFTTPIAKVIPSKITIQADIGGNATKIVLDGRASNKSVFDAVESQTNFFRRGPIRKIINQHGDPIPPNGKMHCIQNLDSIRVEIGAPRPAPPSPPSRALVQLLSTDGTIADICAVTDKTDVDSKIRRICGKGVMTKDRAPYGIQSI